MKNITQPEEDLSQLDILKGSIVFVDGALLGLEKSMDVLEKDTLTFSSRLQQLDAIHHVLHDVREDMADQARRSDEAAKTEE